MVSPWFSLRNWIFYNDAYLWVKSIRNISNYETLGWISYKIKVIQYNNFQLSKRLFYFLFCIKFRISNFCLDTLLHTRVVFVSLLWLYRTQTHMAWLYIYIHTYVINAISNYWYGLQHRAGPLKRISPCEKSYNVWSIHGPI